MVDVLKLDPDRSVHEKQSKSPALLLFLLYFPSNHEMDSVVLVHAILIVCHAGPKPQTDLSDHELRLPKLQALTTAYKLIILQICDSNRKLTNVILTQLGLQKTFYPLKCFCNVTKALM